MLLSHSSLGRLKGDVNRGGAGDPRQGGAGRGGCGGSGGSGDGEGGLRVSVRKGEIWGGRSRSRRERIEGGLRGEEGRHGLVCEGYKKG